MRHFAAAALALALLAGCTAPAQPAKPDAAVARTLALREDGFNRKDLALYMRAVSPRYGGDATGYTRIETRAKALFSAIDKITYTSSERQVYDEPPRVRVVQRYAMELEKGGERISRSGQEQLYLERDGADYKIVDGL